MKLLSSKTAALQFCFPKIPTAEKVQNGRILGNLAAIQHALRYELIIKKIHLKSLSRMKTKNAQNSL